MAFVICSGFVAGVGELGILAAGELFLESLMLLKVVFGSLSGPFVVYDSSSGASVPAALSRHDECVAGLLA